MSVGNPNHDERGRFSSGPGGGGQQARRSSDARGKDPATSRSERIAGLRARLDQGFAAALEVTDVGRLHNVKNKMQTLRRIAGETRPPEYPGRHRSLDAALYQRRR